MDARELQAPFDAAVVVVTRRKGVVTDAIRSIFTQQFDGRVQVLVGADGPAADRDALSQLAAECPARMALTVVDPGYSLARARGGMYAPEAGGSMRTALSYLANSRHVAYLGERNRYAPEHLRELKRAIADKAWAFTTRWFVDARNGAVICRDEWESTGPDHGVYWKSEGGYVAADCLMVDKFACHSALPAWSIASAEGLGDDRSLFKALRPMPHGRTTQPTVYTAIRMERQHPFLLHQFASHGVVLERYVDLTPELRAEIARAAQATTEHAETAKRTTQVSGVEFEIKRR